MPLNYDTGPHDGPAMVRSSLQLLAARKNQLNLDSGSLAALEVGAPHAVYDLRADEIAAGGGLETAHASGFRYLITKDGKPIAAGEIPLDAAGKTLSQANLNYGPFVAATAGALADVARADEVRANVYEVRFLRFSAIYVAALWLKSVAGGADIIIPLAPSALQAGKRYTANEFLAAIRPLAAQRANKADTTKVP